MYSLITTPPHVHYPRVKPIVRETAFYGEFVACAEILPNTWAVFGLMDGVISHLFYSEPNPHGWIAAEAHAKGYVNSMGSVHPFELDAIP